MSIRRGATESGQAATGPWRRVGARLQKLWAWRKQAAVENTLASLEDYQLEDVGIGRGEIPVYARASCYAPQHVSAMLDSLGVGPEWVRQGSAARSQLLRGCRVCPNPQACEKWLLTAEPRDGYRAFCPNAALLDDLPRRRVSTPA